MQTNSERNEILVQKMKDHRFNISSLSRYIEVDRSTLSHIVNGRVPSASVALKIAAAVDSTVEDVFSCLLTR